MSPRKSSTSSANLLPPRPRYLGIEVAGVSLLSGRWLEETLRQRLAEAGEPKAKLRVVRVSGLKAIVEVDQLVAPTARRIWNTSANGVNGGIVTITTRRTWGTLRKGKMWARGSGPAPRGAPEAARART